MKNIENETCTKDKTSNEINFSVAYKKDGDSFQNIMEKILISKIIKNG